MTGPLEEETPVAYDIENDPVYQRFQLIVNGPALFNAIVAGLELGVFDLLADHPDADVELIADSTGLPPHQLRVLLLALCATGLVVKRDGRYRNSTVAAVALAEDRPDSWRNTLIGWQRFQYPAFPSLTSALRTGRNTALDAYPGTGPTLYHRLSHDPAQEAAYHDSIAPFTHLFAKALLEHPEVAGVRHLLDVGGGDGTTAIAFAENHPQSKATIFDFPTVVKHAETLVPAALADRVLMWPGDLFEDEFPTGPDGVLFSHVLEPFSAEQSIGLLTRAYQALPVGGKILAYGMTAPDEEDGGGLLCARLSLFLSTLASGGGMAHPARDYEAWIREAGCRSVATYAGLPYEHSLVVGVK